LTRVRKPTHNVHVGRLPLRKRFSTMTSFIMEHEAFLCQLRNVGVFGLALRVRTRRLETRPAGVCATREKSVWK
jgi:hypothetical protein